MKPNRIFLTVDDAEDWRWLTADPGAHWRDGYSAKLLAYAWDQADGFPPCVGEAFRRSSPVLQNLELLLAFPEQKVCLPGGGSQSQNDVFALAKERGKPWAAENLWTVTVEGKKEEPFDAIVSNWRLRVTPGKQRRLDFLCRILGLRAEEVDGIGYQLLHRVGCAVASARRYGTKHAMTLIHSFSRHDTWFDDFERFASLLGIRAQIGVVEAASLPDGMELYLGWVRGV